MGFSIFAGIAVNVDDPKDSGIILGGGVGIGVYTGIDTLLNNAAEVVVDALLELIDAISGRGN